MKKKVFGKLKSIKEICGLDLVELDYCDGSVYSQHMLDLAGEEFEMFDVSSTTVVDYIIDTKGTWFSVKKEWLKDIREEYEFDVDDKVWVRNYPEEDFVARHFSCITSDKQFACFVNGKTSFTIDSEKDPTTCKWFRCIPHKCENYNPNSDGE